MRLIDADALLDKVKDYGEGQERLLLIDPYWVRKAPTIERPHGEWIYKDMKGQFCSVCDKQSVWKFNFCPNCGSDNRPRILDEAFDGAGKDGNVKEGEAE